MKVAVTGSSGLIGTALVASLRADGHEVIRLVRRTPRGADEVRWDPRAADAGLLASGAPGSAALAGLSGCVHLAGAGVADHRWTARYKAEIRASRVLGTRALAGALAKLSPPPAVLVAASAIGWYGDTGGREVDESAPAGQSFLARLVRDWEAAAGPAATPAFASCTSAAAWSSPLAAAYWPGCCRRPVWGCCPGSRPVARS